MKYRKKPVVIEAFQFDGTNHYKIMEWAHKGLPAIANSIIIREPHPDILSIRTLEGMMQATKGDWIIKGVKCEFYPCKPDIFEATYEPVE